MQHVVIQLYSRFFLATQAVQRYFMYSKRALMCRRDKVFKAQSAAVHFQTSD